MRAALVLLLCAAACLLGEWVAPLATIYRGCKLWAASKLAMQPHNSPTLLELRLHSVGRC